MGKVSYNLVADYFLALANETGELITNLKLQKLVYYAQAWYLAIYDEVLFDEDFQAWVHGPVLPELWQEYRDYKWNPIIREDLDENSLDKIKEQMGVEISGFMAELTDAYFGCGAYELEKMTHLEDPWKNARGNLSSDMPCTSVIDKEDIKLYYRSKVNNG